MRAHLLTLVLVPGLLAGITFHARAQDADTVKAALVIAFSDLVSWSPQPDAYTIGVDGGGNVGDAIQKLAETVRGKTVNIKQISGSDFSGCQIVYVASGPSGGIKPGVLTVGEGEDFTTSGGIIGFVLRDGKVRFLINKSAADQAGIKISPRLLSLAVP